MNTDPSPRSPFNVLALTLIATFLLSLGGGGEVLAKGKKKKRKRHREPVTVPVEVGVGPAAHVFFGELQEQQNMYYGARINLEAVVDKALIKKFSRKIPKKYRKMARSLDEVRVRPFPLSVVPKTLIISPGEKSSMYGAGWDLYGVSTGIGPLKLGLNLQVLYSYITYQDEAKKQQSMNFLRPGAGLTLSLPLQITESVGFNIGWRSTFVPPQEIGGEILALKKSTEGTIWHIGQGFAMITFRIPYTTKL
jgi:hypothetical protein